MPTIILHPSAEVHLHHDFGKSYFVGTGQNLIDLVLKNFDNAKSGFCSGVLEIDLTEHKHLFFSGQVQVQAGDLLVGNVAPRHEGETLQENVYVVAHQKPTDTVMVALYSYDTLKSEGDELCKNKHFDYAIVFVGASINGAPKKHNPSSALRNLIATFMPDDPRGKGGTVYENKDGLYQADFLVQCLKYYLDCRDEWRGWKMCAPTEIMKSVGGYNWDNLDIHSNVKEIK